MWGSLGVHGGRADQGIGSARLTDDDRIEIDRDSWEAARFVPREGRRLDAARHQRQHASAGPRCGSRSHASCGARYSSAGGYYRSSIIARRCARSIDRFNAALQGDQRFDDRVEFSLDARQSVIANLLRGHQLGRDLDCWWQRGNLTKPVDEMIGIADSASVGIVTL